MRVLGASHITSFPTLTDLWGTEFSVLGHFRLECFSPLAHFSDSCGLCVFFYNVVRLYERTSVEIQFLLLNRMTWDHLIIVKKYTFKLEADKHKILAGQKYFTLRCSGLFSRAFLYFTFCCDGLVSLQQNYSNIVKGTGHFKGQTITFCLHIINKLSWAYHWTHP